MKNSDYWRRRAEILEAAKNKSAGEYTVEVQRQFNLAQKTLDEQIEQWYGRFAKNNQITIIEARQWLTGKDLAEFKWDVNEYIKHGKKAKLNPKFIKQLENASARFHISKLEALKLKTHNTVEQLYGQITRMTDSAFGQIYQDMYYHTAFQLQQGVGIGWDIAALNKDQVESVLSKPWTLDKETFSDRIWTQKQSLLDEVHTQLTQNMLLGRAPNEAISAIAKKFNTSKSNAGRLVMTESAYFANEAQKNVYKLLDVEEFEIVGTLDGETCKICGSFDGTHLPMSQYEAGVTAPPFHPWCRCCTAPYFPDNGGERFARDEDGKAYYVPSDMTYTDWKDKFVDSKDKSGLTSTDNKGLNIFSTGGIIENTSEFVPAKTRDEAENYARNILGVQNVSYKGIDIDTANEWNRGLKDNFDRFPELRNNFRFVGESHERNRMLKPIAKQYFLDEYVKLNPNIALAQLEPYADRETAKFMRKMGVVKHSYASSWSPGIPAFEKLKGVTVNRDWGKDSNKFIEALKNDVQNKFHPTGCDSIRSILDHEIGHQLDDLLNLRDDHNIRQLLDSRTKAELTDDISRYAWDNSNQNQYAEMIAEAWAEYCNNPSPRQIASAVGKAIENAYKVKFSTK